MNFIRNELEHHSFKRLSGITHDEIRILVRGKWKVVRENPNTL